ncbi:redox-active disulfide protein 2 [Erysipelotrichaceae bacterium MTC7]|nr:redox-active disulfide protein 2 [Erysipelotrichaceae bacterium MTC7]
MRIFGKQKVQEQTSNIESVVGADVKILGSGCAKCNELSANAKQALAELGLSEDIEKVTDMARIAAYGVMSTPAIVYKDKVLAFGKVLSVSQIKELLTK